MYPSIEGDHQFSKENLSRLLTLLFLLRPAYYTDQESESEFEVVRELRLESKLTATGIAQRLRTAWALPPLG